MCTSPSALQISAGVGADARHARLFFLVPRKSRRDVPHWGDACRHWATILHSFQAALAAFRTRTYQPIDDLISRWSLRAGASRQEHAGPLKGRGEDLRKAPKQQTRYESESEECVSRHRDGLELRAVAESSLTRWRPSETRSAALLCLVSESRRR